jgi:hypothetical protein
VIEIKLGSTEIIIIGLLSKQQLRHIANLGFERKQQQASEEADRDGEGTRVVPEVDPV